MLLDGQRKCVYTQGNIIQPLYCHLGQYRWTWRTPMQEARHRKTNTAWSHLYAESKIVKFIEAESRMVVSRSWGWGWGKQGGDKLQYSGHLMQRAYSLEKTLMLGKTEGNRRRGQHLWLSGHEFEQTPGDSERQGSLVCCSSWGCKESDMTEPLNWTE